MFDRSPARSRRNVLFIPDWRSGNPYQNLLADGLRQVGLEVEFANPSGRPFNLNELANKHSRLGVIHVHWTQGLLRHIYWSGSSWIKRVKLLFFALDILVCRARGIAVVWTVHNLVEHESSDPQTEISARRILVRFGNAVICHSREAIDTILSCYRLPELDKIKAIPHGNYLNSYSEDPRITQRFRNKFQVENENIVLLFFGGIRRYKGLGVLVEAFKDVDDARQRLLIAGKPFENDIEEWLTGVSASDPRIRLSLGFVPDEQVASFFRIADVVVLPFQATLTSGSVILAMGFGKCLVLPEEARVLGLPGDEGALYYKDLESLCTLLRDMSQDRLAEMGAYNREVAESLDWTEIARSTAETYA